jgi:hypothetical protein
VLWYLAAQIVDGLLGVVLAHVMLSLPVVTLSQHARTGVGQWSGEFIATLGLLLIIVTCAEKKPEAVPCAVGGLHHQRVLVYILNFLRESGRDHCAVRDRYICGHPAQGCLGIYFCATSRRCGSSSAAVLV